MHAKGTTVAAVRAPNSVRVCHVNGAKCANQQPQQVGERAYDAALYVGQVPISRLRM